MKTIIIGKTDSTLTLNKCASYVRGKTETVVDVVNDDQRRELAVLERHGLIVVINEDDANEVQIKAPAKQMSEGERVARAEAETQKMGSKAFIATGDGVKERRMTYSSVDQINESESTRASIEAMKEIEEEEKADDLVTNEDRFDVSEKMGNKATVATGAQTKEIKLTNSVMPESENIKKQDPFIDKEDKSAKKMDDPTLRSDVIKKGDEDTIDFPEDDLFIAGNSPSDDEEDPFIEV